MKTNVLLLSVVLILSACKPQTPEAPAAPQGMAPHDHMAMMRGDSSMRDGVFIHISEGYNDPHRVLMPLKMATMMAMDKDVLVYMDIKAVELAVKGAKDMKYADFESFQTYIKKLADMKVGVYACPTCLKIAGYKPEDLMDGIQVAQKDKFFDFTKGRIITLDY
jgi:predicted peroxiredoxin